MCWHDRRDEERYRVERAQKMAALGKLPTTTTVSVLDADGKFIGAMPVEWRSKQKIANTIRDLKAWHPNAVQADLYEVNKLRMEYHRLHPTETMLVVSERRLPEPTGEAEPYAFAKPHTEWSEELKEAGAYLHAQNAKLSRARATA